MTSALDSLPKSAKHFCNPPFAPGPGITNSNSSKLVKQDSKERVFNAPPVMPNDVPDEILAHAISRSVSVSEFVGAQHWIGRPRRRCASHSPEIDLLPLDGKAPVAREYDGGL